jgi:hypothetical protein
MTLQELFETAHTNARRMFLEEGEIVPTWHAVPREGPHILCATPWKEN